MALACAPTWTPAAELNEPARIDPPRRVSPDLKDPFGNRQARHEGHGAAAQAQVDDIPREHWSGYPPEVELRFYRAYDRFGDQLDDWTLGSLAPALSEWIGPGEELAVWIGDTCAPTIVRRPDASPDNPLDHHLDAKVGIVEESGEGRRARSYARMRIGHELVDTGCRGTDVFEAGEWVEHSNLCLGDPVPLGTLASLDGGVAWYSRHVGRPQLVCAPEVELCSNGAAACPSCGIMTWSPNGQGLLGWSPPLTDCDGSCRIDADAMTEIAALLARYGARPRAVAANWRSEFGVDEPGVAIHLDELSCRVAATRF